MRIIKTIKDIKLLRSDSVIKKNILDEIELNFNHICNNIRAEMTLDEFSLVDTGIIVLLEAGDNVADLSEIGLNSEENGLFGATPEWLEQKELTNCTLIHTCIACNNEYSLSVFFEKGNFGVDVERLKNSKRI